MEIFPQKKRIKFRISSKRNSPAQQTQQDSLALLQMDKPLVNTQPVQKRRILVLKLFLTLMDKTSRTQGEQQIFTLAWICRGDQ